MDRIKTSKKQKKLSKNNLQTHNPFKGDFSNSRLIKEILIDALMENDLEVFEDVLLAYLRACSKSKLAKQSGLGRQTLYDLLDAEKEFNPTLSTLAALLNTIAA